VAEALDPGNRPAATGIADTLFALAGPDTDELLTHHAGHSPADYRAWLADTVLAVLDPSRRGTGR
jgi:hypothetical protein